MSTIMNSQLMMDTNKLTRPNFLDWLKILRIVLKRERLAHVLVESLPQSPTVDASETVRRAYQKRLVDSARARLIILTSMSPKLQKQYKTVDANSIVRYLRELYNEQARTERFKVSNFLFSSKMEKGTIAV